MSCGVQSTGTTTSGSTVNCTAKELTGRTTCQPYHGDGSRRISLPHYTVLDSSCWNKTGLGPSIAETMIRCGVRWTPSDRNRLAGKMELHRRLSDDPYTNEPRMKIFNTCQNTINNCRYSAVQNKQRRRRHKGRRSRLRRTEIHGNDKNIRIRNNQ